LIDPWFQAAVDTQTGKLGRDSSRDDLFEREADLVLNLALGSRVVQTAPAKPSVQTQILLDAMVATSQTGDDRWNKIAESLDLLFDKIDEIKVTQRQIKSYEIRTLCQSKWRRR
jgi:hypothetical protein